MREVLLTSTQVLDFLQIGRTKLWMLVREGAFPAYRLGEGKNGPLRFRESDVVNWLEGHRVVPSREDQLPGVSTAFEG